MDECDPGIGFRIGANEKTLRRTAARQARADQARREHARVVDDQQIAWLQ
jgi:hypothetical protein